MGGAKSVSHTIIFDISFFLYTMTRLSSSKKSTITSSSLTCSNLSRATTAAAAAACCAVAIAQQHHQQPCCSIPSALKTTTLPRLPPQSCTPPFVTMVESLRGGSTNNNNTTSNTSAAADNVLNSSSSSKHSSSSSASASSTHTNSSNKEGKNTSSRRTTQKHHGSSSAKHDDHTKKHHSSSNKKPQQHNMHVPEDYYELLGVPKTATAKQIQKAYRRKAVQYHPDKTNGDRTMFDHISTAYDVLSDENKRSIYDRYGKKGLEHPGASSSSSPFSSTGAAADIFSSFFGPGFSTSTGGPFFRTQQQQQQQQPMRNRDVRYQIEVTLEDLYKGTTQRVTLAKQSAANQRNNNKEVEIVIERGMKDGQSVVLSGENDAIPNAIPGNIIFLLSQARHPIFTRKNNDLAIVVNLTLKEALCGFGTSKTVRHLDGRTVTLQTKDSSVIQNGEFHVLKGEGMPVRGRSGVYGDLYVQFRVKMPTTTTKQKQQQQQFAQMTKGEREVLGNLLDLLSTADTSATGTSTSSTSATGYLAERQRSKIKASLLHLLSEYGVTEEDMKKNLQQQTTAKRDSVDTTATTTTTFKKVTNFLQPASAADFGTSYPEENADEGADEEEDEYDRFMRNDPFQQFRFFSSGRSSRSSFDFNNANAQQCQQM